MKIRQDLNPVDVIVPAVRSDMRCERCGAEAFAYHITGQGPSFPAGWELHEFDDGGLFARFEWWCFECTSAARMKMSALLSPRRSFPTQPSQSRFSASRAAHGCNRSTTGSSAQTLRARKRETGGTGREHEISDGRENE